MIYGFPGRTTEYLSSYSVDMIMNQSDPDRVKIREMRLKIMDGDMQKSDAVRIQYAAKYAGLANYWKKWEGEINGLKKLDAINKKREFEKKFIQKANESESAKTAYSKLFTDFEKEFTIMRPLNKQKDYFQEALIGIELVNYLSTYYEVIEALKSGKKAVDLQKQIDKLKTDLPVFYKDFHPATDEKICSAMLKMVSSDIPKEQQPGIIAEIEKKYNGKFSEYASKIYSHSIFTSQDATEEVLNKLEKSYKKILKDPIYQLMQSCYGKFVTEIRPKFNEEDAKITALNRTYMKGMRELITDKKYYPDANSTLRVAYGKVNGYYPKDGVFYNYYTTLEGIMEKENPAVDEFVVSPRLKDLYVKKEYGNYADKNGELRVAFCASNHTTGGNSGSPVFNGNLELIGTNFDRNWEGTMSDIMYDPDQVRNIVLDVRYTLFVIDKYAGAGYLVKEMKIVK